MRVLFIGPARPREMNDFTRGLAAAGAEVIGVGDLPQAYLPEMVKRSLSGYFQVPTLWNVAEAYERILPIARKVKPDRIETLFESHTLLAAHLRDATGTPGMSADTIRGFRDKSVMRARAEAAGIRVPKWRRVTTLKETEKAIEEIGLPVVIKPVDSAGSQNTYRISDRAEFEVVKPLLRVISLANVEEFVDGEEFTYDTVCIDGKPAWESCSQYHPRPLDYHTHEWISPGQIVFRDPFARPDLVEGMAFGRKVLTALGMGTGFTHMEWYRKSNGEIVFGEVGARSGGNNFVDQYNYVNDFDIFVGWAQAVCWGRFEQVPGRKYHSGIVFKRAIGNGRISGYEGLDRVLRRLGDGLCMNTLLPIGTPRRDWRRTIQSDGFICFRHPNYDECKAMLDFVVSELKVYAA